MGDIRHSRREQVIEEAFRHRTKLWAYLIGLCKDVHLAEDLLQETFMVICRKWEQYEPGTNSLAWVMKIARYQFLSSTKTRKKTEIPVEGRVLEKALLAEQSTPVELGFRRQALRHCLSLLEGRSREVFRLRYESGAGVGEISERLQMKENALYVLLSRVRRTVRNCVSMRLKKGSTS